MKLKSSKLLLIGVATLGVASIAAPQLGDLLKGGGIYFAVQKFGKDINRAVNGVTKHTDTNTSFTKVVPIISFGDGKEAGAAQVMGARRQVEKVTTVLQMEGKALGAIRFKALIPIASKDAHDTHAVDGVGVSGVIDLKL